MRNNKDVLRWLVKKMWFINVVLVSFLALALGLQKFIFPFVVMFFALSILLIYLLVINLMYLFYMLIINYLYKRGVVKNVIVVNITRAIILIYIIVTVLIMVWSSNNLFESKKLRELEQADCENWNGI